ncbi:TRAP transporter substrate-binding protein [Alkalihalobacillus oceani]|uniref:TRAP transporter substrate-binding protein n=1 Tax=Halalkalibacter oceani TaxID=1653776 RepID=UPI0020424982|nr:TRAP transporter substrate-binding protein [Halalkalibacter oceani]MCM3762070.1 TRAP transporter substrate-binding protein [Halalkalibacter oceani]
MKKWLFLTMSVLTFFLVLSACGQTTGTDTTQGDLQEENPAAEPETSDSGDAVASDESYVIKFAHVVRPSTAKGQAAEMFADLIEERTDGQITVEIYPDSQLGSDREITEQMQSGNVHMNAPFTGVLPSFVPQFQVFDLPFIFENPEEAYDSMHGALGESLNDYLVPQGLRAVGYWDGGLKHFTNSIRAIETPEDMDGLRMRASQSPLIISQFRALNAGGVSIDFSELYTALQNGTVDGQENPLSNIVSRKFYEVQDYVTLSGHGYMGYVHLISESFYQDLPKDLQVILDEVATEVSLWQWEQAAQDEIAYMEELEESGIEITELTPENREKFIEVTKGTFDEFLQIDGAQELLDLLNK